MEGYDRSTYGRSFADVYDDWYGDVSDVEGTVAYIAELAGRGGRILELGVGSGRLATPLADGGFSVVGLDASDEMLAQIPDGAVLSVQADMADAPLRDDCFDVAFIAFNTFFNLTTEAAQADCLVSARRALKPGGRLVIETFVPPEADEVPDRGLSTRSVDVDRVVLTATVRDTTDQTIAGQHIEITQSGIKLRPWHIRYLTPDQIDELAHDAGLTRIERWADWHGGAFDHASSSCVTTYRVTT